MIRLSVLDQDREVTSRTGEGHVAIPAFFFLTNNGEQPSALKMQEASPNQDTSAAGAPGSSSDQNPTETQVCLPPSPACA